MNIPDELVIAMGQPVLERQLGDPEIRKEVLGVILNHPVAGERLLQMIAASQQSELMTPAEAAELLRTTPDTLLKKHAAWKLDVSTALGIVHLKSGKMRMESPRFYRSQIMARMHACDIKGSDGADHSADSAKVTNFPEQRKQQRRAS